MSALEDLFRWIETRYALLLFMLLALVAQIPQVAELVLHIVGKSDWLAYIHAYAFAIAFDGAILIFVTRKKTGLAWAFAMGSMAMNATHYVPPVLGRHPNLATPQAVVDIVGAVLLSVAIPFALAQYSHVAAEDEASPKEHAVPVPIPEASPKADNQPGSLPDKSTATCYTEGCANSAEACEHGCGTSFCVTHKGAHLRWHCTHNPASRAFHGAPIPHAEAFVGHLEASV